ncbi:MAG TPA: prephenate dehydratase [Methanosarcinales archaeon]|nr:prephenate dehydratase [Methanosarcinales archaeon]
MIGSAISNDDLRTVIGVLGPEGTFSEQAAMRWIGYLSAELRYFDDIDEIISSVGTTIDFGVVPIENSLEGSIGQTLDALLKYPVTIVGEIILPIQHCLLLKSGVIHTIMSHPQAIAQCRHFLEANYRNADIQVTASTAHAAKLASAQEGVAAIAPAETAAKYGLEIVSENIQNVNENYTRFIVLGTDTDITAPSGHDKTSIIVDLRKDRPGALYELLGEFASRDINLTKIESRPTKKALGDYLFYIDFQGHIHDDLIFDAMRSIEGMVAMLRVLGSYRIG